MKKSTLLFRSLAIVILITGVAHLTSVASQNIEPNYPEVNSYRNNEVTNQVSTDTKSTYNSDTDYILGKWRVPYNEEDFKGSIIYKIQKERTVYSAYTYEYVDENGYSEKAEGNKILTLKNFDGYKGSGTYRFKYEEKEYQIDCKIDMVDENTFQLSYEYYDYSGVETWKRQ